MSAARGPLPSRRVVLRHLGPTDYVECWRQMRAFTDGRGDGRDDEFWLTEHPSVYTLGQAGRREHLLATQDIPVVESDRGGQVTYHGPGQVVVYVLLDLRRAGLGVKRLVHQLEEGTLAFLGDLGITATRRDRAPGVYVDDAKIAALGLRIRNGCSYHGVALNVDMDLSPFAGINPCGYQGLAVTQLKDLGHRLDMASAGEGLARSLARALELDLEAARERGALPC